MRMDDFECAQCLLLLCMYSHNETQAVNMWYASGPALRLATGLDLHRGESLVGLDLRRSEMANGCSGAHMVWIVILLSIWVDP
jgi:hypothetical protein